MKMIVLTHFQSTRGKEKAKRNWRNKVSRQYTVLPFKKIFGWFGLQTRTLFIDNSTMHVELIRIS